jgi:hypothetical protein
LVQIKAKLPQDGEAWRYNKVGTALNVSHVQLSRYMSSADYALREATAGAPIGFSDRKQVEEILDKTRGSGYGVRDVVYGIVVSDLFRNK